MLHDNFSATPDFTSTTLDLGELTAKYELQHELGRGGMAVVYVARDRSTGTERAIKVIHARFLADPDALARFAREARLVAGLGHPRIVAIHSIESAAGVGVALVMDRVAGRTVKQLIRDTGPLPFAQVRQILEDVAEALAFAHASGVVHRDVKPENIFIDEASGRALLADFGIARSMHGETSLTMVGMAIGTPTYMSPEQIDGTVDGRSDLYSLGLVGWEMLTGQRPWDGDNLYKVIYRQKHDHLAPIRSVRPDTPEPIAVAVERLLEKDPTARWASANEFRRQLSVTVVDSRVPVASMSQAIHPVEESSWFRKEWMEDDHTAWNKGRPVSAPMGVFGRRTGIAAGIVALVAGASIFAARAIPSVGSALGVGSSSAGVNPLADNGGSSSEMAGTLPPNGWSDGAAVANTPVSHVRIAAGAMHTCAVTPAGVAYCWGDNGGGQVGARTTPVTTAPTGVSTKMQFANIAPGSAHTCAVGFDARAYCWGSDDHGQLGDGPANVPARPLPMPVAGGQLFLTITTGVAHSCALTGTNKIYCWGAGTEGELGDGNNTDRDTPVLVDPRRPFTSVVAGWKHNCALTEDGRAYCWGANDQGQLGDGTTNNRSTPRAVRSRIRFVTLTAGSTHTCGLSASGEMYCWGDNKYGQLGDSGSVRRTYPVRVHAREPFVTIAAGGVYNCAITKSHEAWCWGRNNFGQLGDGSWVDAPIPAKVTGNHQFATLSAFGAHTCGTTLKDDIFCWGDNLDGQLGDGTREHRSRPVYIEKPST